MRVLLIHNPGAGSGVQPDRVQLERMLRAAGHGVRYVRAPADDWRAALDEPADLVVVAGGDGTVGRVAKAMIGRAGPFTVLPMGTANNISRSLGLLDRPLTELVAGWADGRELACDAGVAHGPWGVRHFLEACGAGLFAAAMPAADDNKTLESLADAPARLAYALQLLRERLAHCPAHTLSLSLDGRDLSGDYVLFEAMNIHYVGPNLYLAPGGDVTDGLLDVLLVPAAERERLAHHLATWQDGMLWPSELPTWRARSIELAWSGYPLHIDDSTWPEAGAQVGVVPGRVRLGVQSRALRFLLPAGEGAVPGL